MAASGGGSDDDDETRALGRLPEAEDPTPTTLPGAVRTFTWCMPCVGRGTIRVLAGSQGLRETLRTCPVWYRGTGNRIMPRSEASGKSPWRKNVRRDAKGRGHRPVQRRVSRRTTRTAFGRVVCSVCGGRFRPLSGLRVPNHVSQRDARPASAKPGSAKSESAKPESAKPESAKPRVREARVLKARVSEPRRRPSRTLRRPTQRRPAASIPKMSKPSATR